MNVHIRLLQAHQAESGWNNWVLTMTTRTILVLFFTSILLSCNKESLLSPGVIAFDKGARLVEKQTFVQNSKTPHLISKFDYRADGLLDMETKSDGEDFRIISYEKYNYSDGLLEKILLFDHTWANQLLLIDSTVFMYKNDILIEQVNYSFLHVNLTYSYSADRLIEQRMFENDEVMTTINFKYLDSGLIDQITYTPPYRRVKFSKHVYQGELLIRKNDYNKDSELIRKTIYTYDRNGNLLVEDPKDLVPISGGEMDKYYRYFYE